MTVHFLFESTDGTGTPVDRSGISAKLARRILLELPYSDKMQESKILCKCLGAGM